MDERAAEQEVETRMFLCGDGLGVGNMVFQKWTLMPSDAFYALQCSYISTQGGRLSLVVLTAVIKMYTQKRRM